MLFITTFICNTNKLVISWINECFQISNNLCNKYHMYFFTQRSQKKYKIGIFLVYPNYSCNYLNIFI